MSNPPTQAGPSSIMIARTSFGRTYVIGQGTACKVPVRHGKARPDERASRATRTQVLQANILTMVDLPETLDLAEVSAGAD